MRPFSDGVRRTATGLWAVGAGLAGGTAVLALAHSMLGYVFVYLTVSVALGALGVATYRRNRWAEIVTLILLASQVIGAFGAGWELASGRDDTAKARHLHDLGVNYRLALVANLAYSVVAAVTFAWVIVRGVRLRSRRT